MDGDSTKITNEDHVNYNKNKIQPLARFIVIDLTRERAGPTAVRQLADFGAQVINVEMPGEDDNIRHKGDFQNMHRNKRSITLNLKQPEGLEILKSLVKNADVLIENYRPSVKYRLGIDYESLRKINPRLVYASISGFGQDGPYANRPGYDQVAQGMGGLMGITGEPEQGPLRVGIPLADLSSGILCANGILTALLEREVSGNGQWVQTSLLASQIFMLDLQAARYLIDGEIPKQVGNNHPTTIPTGVFKTLDGLINIAASNQEMYRRLCKAIGHEHLSSNTDYLTEQDRSKNRDKLNMELNEITKTKTSAEWIEVLNAAGVSSGPIYAMNEVFEDPQVKHIGIATPLNHPTRGQIELLGQPVTLSRTSWAIKLPTPEKGQHTREILTELGYNAATIDQLEQCKVVFTRD
ncbi:unnamed protein product [Didymodactylos carnosus]|uniref:Formyl-CoA transferase n=1 Tax=Didymodactylos carnosus TaxID=1234261 RepID=A0A8S2FIU3_9BILA|nr:unnamed protein product [Didymodactylos carnosus]CAF4260001.1 unnamed protein product [Didymodactylos carnosus]